MTLMWYIFFYSISVTENENKTIICDYIANII